MSKATIVCIALSLVACASGGQPDDNGGVQDAAMTGGPHDASNVTAPDAPKIKMDGGVTQQPDAQVSQLPPDASQQGPFCTANAQCTNAGECCVTLGGPSGFCAPGTVVLGQCFPQ